jgi:Protein of unknown function (DUF3237)
MELELEFTFEATLAAPTLALGSGPYGTRAIVSVAGGWVKGERISGTLVGAAGDWVLIGPDGYGRLDVRAQIQTDDDAVLYLSYPGVLEMNEKVGTALAGGGEGTDFGDHYFRTTPRLETGDPRYAWVNQTIFVGRGRLGPGTVLYEVYRVT